MMWNAKKIIEEKIPLGRVLTTGDSLRVDVSCEEAVAEASAKEERIKAEQRLAIRMVEVARGKIAKELRFLNRALFRMPLRISETVLLFGTNGKSIWLNPEAVIAAYKKDKARIAHAFLHMILHCIYRHPFRYKEDGGDELLDLSCDLAVEKTMMDLHLPQVATREDGERRFLLKQLQDAMEASLKEARFAKRAASTGTGNSVTPKPENILKNAFRPGATQKKPEVMMTAEHIYHFLFEHEELAQKFMQEAALFHADDHDKWKTPDYSEAERHLAQNDTMRTDVVTGQLGCHEADTEGDENDEFGDTDEVFAGEGSADWEDVSEHAQNDLAVISKEQGFGAGSMLEHLRAVNRKKVDYTEFLQRFAVPGEEVHVNPDEFDYIYYTYGLSTYGNMPLIEPLEYRESRRIREFVIAIDTSGSCRGETVEKFLRKSYQILKNSGSYFEQVNIHIIQCDEKIQKDDVIHSEAEFEEYMNDVELLGFGGTDFRPVFAYVDKLLARREFQNLKGLIYFTDGFGSFPEARPDYETAFLFVDEGYAIPEVPAWAVRLVLEEDEI